LTQYLGQMRVWEHGATSVAKKRKELSFLANTINTMVAAGQKWIYSVSMCVFMKPLVMLHMSSSEGQWKGVCVCVCVCIYTQCVYQTQCLLGVWGWRPTDPTDWLFMPLKYDWHAHTQTHTWDDGGYDCGSTKSRPSQDSEQSIHKSRVTPRGPFALSLHHRRDGEGPTRLRNENHIRSQRTLLILSSQAWEKSITINIVSCSQIKPILKIKRYSLKGFIPPDVVFTNSITIRL